jgi:hypothetical protein
MHARLVVAVVKHGVGAGALVFYAQVVAHGGTFPLWFPLHLEGEESCLGGWGRNPDGVGAAC